jgi:hypothetical protein
MRVRHVTRAVSTLLALSAFALAFPRRPAAASRVCSRIPVAVGRDPATTYFTGRAMRDSVRTGPGTLREQAQAVGGHWGSGRSRTIFGQVVQVEKLGGNGAPAIEAAFGRGGGREVIVVPWDYDPACQPVPWASTARWVASDEPGFYRVRVRAESLWVAGRPVLDAFFADMEPYPHGVFFQRGFRGMDALRRGPSLTPAEYFELFAALPDLSRATRDPAVAAAELDAWEREHPAIAHTFPAPDVLRITRMALQRR